MRGRVLTSRTCTSASQGMLFSVFWRLGQDHYAKLEKEKAAAAAAV